MPRNNNQAATIGFESDLWRAADALRSNMDAVWDRLGELS